MKSKSEKSSGKKRSESVASQTEIAQLQHLKERQRFRALLLANPNYFGNLVESPLAPVLPLQANTFYEEIGCVGFQPQFDRLETVVYVKQPGGYGGNVCSNGTPEYVRFYMSCDNGATWEDLGLTSFTAYDIPEGTKDDKRLEYAVTLNIDPSKKERFCFFEKLCRVRAILSWNFPPPPNQPNFVPVWGDIHNTVIQLDPRRFFILGDLLKEAEVVLPPKFKAAVNLDQQIPSPEKEALSLKELQALYKDKKVEVHRYALTEIHKLAVQPQGQVAFSGAGSLQALLPDVKINIQDLIAKLFPTDGNTSYEEMECIGYNPDLDTMVATIRIKRPFGYLGGLCRRGSREYVTFWADLNNNGTFETCLGTTSVNVHDIQSIPREGLEYAVFLPVNLKRFRRPCHEGPRVIRIRAIMSWQAPPPCWNPNYIPVWGNREETLIHIKPGRQTQPGTHFPIIQTVGSMDVGDINALTGLANGPAVLAGFTAHDSPFGGEVVITGHIGNPTDISSGAPKLKYRIEVSKDGGLSWSRLTNSFTLHRDQLLNGIWSDLPPILQTVDGEDYYEYQEDLSGGFGNAQIFPVGNLLGRWQTGGESGMWKIKITAKHPVTGLTWTSNVVTVRLDNKAPEVSLAITSGGGACADFNTGDVIAGTYSVSDEHFGSLRFSLLPSMIGGVPSGGSFTNPAPLPAGTTMPLVRTYAGGVPASGEAGAWSLDTKGMQKCGYVIELSVWDRTIVNSGFVGRYNRDVVGLCLRG
jgi:hypothetical protein